MRIILLVLAMVGSSAAGYALESTAGADTVANSQVGIDAKLDASNALLTTAINALTNKIKTCSAKKALYNPGGTGADADGCVLLTSPGANVTVATSTVANAHHSTNYTSWVTADYCALSDASYDFTGHAAGCTIQRSGGDWRAVAKSNNSSNTAACQLVCFKLAS